METLTYGISTNYVKSWTWETGIRELFQNWLDADGQEHGSVDYDVESQMLILTNPGQLTRKSLLLGESEKPSGSIGQFGEGYKLGALALLREGKSLTLQSGTMSFCAGLYAFEDEFCLQFSLREADTEYPDQVRAIIHPITVAEWEQIDQLFSPDALYTTDRGEVLEEQRLYVGGLYVKDLDKVQYTYGYNLRPSNVQINRDREMIESFDLKYEIAAIWSELQPTHPDKVWDLISKQSIEVAHLHYHIQREQKKNVVNRMLQSGLLFVRDDHQASKAQDLGHTAVVNSDLGRLTESHIIAETEKRKQQDEGQLLDPTPEQAQQLERIQSVLYLLFDREVPIQLKAFRRSEQSGSHHKIKAHHEIYIRPGRYAEMLQTAIHEMVHATTGLQDNTAGFQAALEQKMVKLIEYYEQTH